MTDRQEEWVLVPKKPTLEMSRAVREEMRFCDPVGIYQKMLAVAPTHPAITHCDNCGCDWLDNGLNPVGCPYCKLSAEIEALRAEVERLRADLAESDEIRERLRHLLTRTAAALKGEPPEGVWHSWHDLPEKATQLAEALKKVAQSLEWYAHGGCRGFDDEAPLPTSEAVELAKRTIAKVRA